MTENVSKPKRDSLLAHCVARAVIAEYGAEKALEKLEIRPGRASKWALIREGVKATPKASRVAGFIVMWTIAMRDEDRDGYSITEYQRYWNEGERQAYRLQKEFRELWPEYETPDDLARKLVRLLDDRMSRREIAALPSKLQVTA